MDSFNDGWHLPVFGGQLKADSDQDSTMSGLSDENSSSASDGGSEYKENEEDNNGEVQEVIEESPVVIDEDPVSEYLKGYQEAQDRPFIESCMQIANEFKTGVNSNVTISRSAWGATHYHGFVSYVICRILSNQSSSYNPTDNAKCTPMYFIDKNLKLEEEVKNYCQYKFGATGQEIRTILDFQANKFKRKGTTDGHWFYGEIHKRIQIHGWKFKQDKRPGHPVKPKDFKWCRQYNNVKDEPKVKVEQQVKKGRKGKKVTKVKKENRTRGKK